MEKTKPETPASRLIAENVLEETCAGHYSVEDDTWSNREFALAASKKHNEDM